jgi:hypothetical protein
MATLTKELLKELECPVCLEYFRQPIILCRSGHSVCEKCRSQLEKCPICRSIFLSTRNITLEAVTSKLTVACKYRSSGCNMAFMLVNITAHKEKCLWRHYKCPMPNCSSECHLTDLRKHLNNVHGAALHADTQNSVTTLEQILLLTGIKRYYFLMNYLFTCVQSEAVSFTHTCFTLDLRRRPLNLVTAYKS